MTRWLLLAGAIVSEVTGSLSLNGAVEHPALYLLAAAGFIGAFAFLAAVLRRRMPLGLAYGIWAATGVALTAVLSTLIFDETLTAWSGLGIVLIIGGVLLVELGSRGTHAPPRTPGETR